MRMFLGLLLVSVLLALPATASEGEPPNRRRLEHSTSTLSIPETVARMTLRQKIGQLLMSGVSGQSLSVADRDALERSHIGGVIIFGDNYSNQGQLSNFADQVQRAIRRGSGISAGALISADQEGGVVKRFPDLPPRYSAPEMGRIGQEDVAFRQGRATGRGLISIGVNVDLAPVADIDLPPNHVMRSRSFGSNRYEVARLASAFARGLQRSNVAAAAKHFPGLGGATRNSDDGPSYVRRSKQELRNVDAIPFKRLISGGIRMMMVGHAMYPKDGGRKPASLNRHITNRRLRKQLGFKGVAISDAVEAVAWRFNGDVVKACKKSIQAGIDVALLTSSPATAGQCAEKVYAAVRNGVIPKDRIDRAAERVLRLKRWLGVF